MSKNDSPTDAFDSLFKETLNNISNDNVTMEDIILPAKCMKCLTANICSPISSFIQLLKIGIKIEIQSCPYYRELRLSEPSGSGKQTT